MDAVAEIISLAGAAWIEKKITAALGMGVAAAFACMSGVSEER